MTTPLSLLELAALLDSLSENFKLLLFKPGEAEAIAELLRAAHEVITAARNELIDEQFPYADGSPGRFCRICEITYGECRPERCALARYTALTEGKP